MVTIIVSVLVTNLVPKFCPFLSKILTVAVAVAVLSGLFALRYEIWWSVFVFCIDFQVLLCRLSCLTLPPIFCVTCVWFALFVLQKKEPSCG